MPKFSWEYCQKFERGEGCNKIVGGGGGEGGEWTIRFENKLIIGGTIIRHRGHEYSVIESKTNN